MKKLLAMSLAVVMVFAMVVPMTVSAAADGEVLYSNDFTTAIPTDDFIGTAASAEGFTSDLSSGKAHVSVPVSTNKGQEAARLPLYEITDEESFTAILDYTVNSTPTKWGVGLIFADNLEATDYSFDVLWARTQWSGLYHNYGDGGVKPTADQQDDIFVCEAGNSYRLEIYVKDTDNRTLKQNEFRITNTTTNTVIHEGTFVYHVSDEEGVTNSEALLEKGEVYEKKMLGLWALDVDLTLNNFVVYNGRAPIADNSDFTGTSVTAGEDYSINFVADLPLGVAATELTTDFTFNGNTVNVVGVDAGAGKAAFTFDGVAPQAMGDTIKAELKYNGGVIDTKEYTVADNLKAIVANEGDKYSAKDVAFAKAALIYGGAAQEYKGYNTDALVSEGVVADAIDPIGDYQPNKSGEGTNAKIVAAGVHFDYVNRLYFVFRTNDIANTTVYIASTPVSPDKIIDCGDGTYKVYTSSYTAAQLSTSYLNVTVEVNDVEEHSVSYGVYTYISRMWDNANIGDLVKALYAYAEAADAYNA